MPVLRYKRRNGADYVFFSPHAVAGLGGYFETACNTFKRYAIRLHCRFRIYLSCLHNPLADEKATGTNLMACKGVAVTWLQRATYCSGGLSALCLWLCPARSKGQPACRAIRQSSREPSPHALSAMLPMVHGPIFRMLQRGTVFLDIGASFPSHTSVCCSLKRSHSQGQSTTGTYTFTFMAAVRPMTAKGAMGTACALTLSRGYSSSS